MENINPPYGCFKMDVSKMKRKNQVHFHHMPKWPILSNIYARLRLLTVDKLLFLRGGDADQMGVELLTLQLCLGPGVSLLKVQIAAAHELQPAISTAHQRCKHTKNISEPKDSLHVHSSFMHAH